MEGKGKRGGIVLLEAIYFGQHSFPDVLQTPEKK